MTKSPVITGAVRTVQLVLLLATCLWSAPSVFAKVIERDGFRFEQLPMPDWVEPVELPETWPQDAPGALATGTRTWSVDWHTRLHGSEPIHYHELVVEALASDQVSNVARHDLSFNPDYQRLQIHAVEVRRDGVWSDRLQPERITLARREARFESDMETGTISALIVVADVRTGDLVRLRWSVIGNNPILETVWHDRYAMAWFDPILNLRVRVDFPPGPRPEVRRIQGAPEPRWSKLAQGERLEFRRERLEAVAYEEQSPQGDELLPAVELAARRSWADVVQWALPLYPASDPLPEDLEARVATWRAQPRTEQAVLEALQIVQEEVRYHAILLGDSTHRPAPPRLTWERRYGDCKDKALLLSRLLQALDLDAVPALVSMQRGPGIRESLPAATQFDHVIVRLQMDGQTYWLDPTMTQQRGPLALRRAASFGVALAIAPGVGKLEEMGPSPTSNSEIEERYQVEADGTVLLSIDTRLTGPAAESRRRDWLGTEPAQLERGFADHYRRLHGELEVIDAPRLEDDAETGVLRLQERYRLRQPWSSNSGTTRQFELYADSLRDLFLLSGTLDRRSALSRPHPVTMRQRSVFELPESWRSFNVPERQLTEDPSFRYEREVGVDARSVQVEHRVTTLADRIETVDLTRHYENRRQAAQQLGLRLAMQPPAEDLKQQREQRLRGLLRDSVNRRGDAPKAP